MQSRDREGYSEVEGDFVVCKAGRHPSCVDIKGMAARFSRQIHYISVAVRSTVPLRATNPAQFLDLARVLGYLGKHLPLHYAKPCCSIR